MAEKISETLKINFRMKMNMHDDCMQQAILSMMRTLLLNQTVNYIKHQRDILLSRWRRLLSIITLQYIVSSSGRVTTFCVFICESM